MKSTLLFFLTPIACVVCFLGTAHAQTRSLPININFEKVSSAWLSWQNQERTTLHIPAYTWNQLLHYSAQQWAETLKNKWTTTHRRLSTDGYYNYRNIKNRFNDQWVTFHDESGTMFSESLGWGYYSCKKADCTDDLIKAISSTFRFFMREKWKSYQPHYRAIVSKNFTDLWLGIAISGKRYYLVSHYGKNVIASSGTKMELAKK